MRCGIYLLVLMVFVVFPYSRVAPVKPLSTLCMELSAVVIAVVSGVSQICVA